MIQASDLRIGNYVITLCGYEKITDVLRDSINTYNHKYLEYELVKPIPLTEEILLKCGFIRLNSNYLVKGSYFIHFENNLIMCKKSGVLLSKLHQLQNLYWCLCGEELQIEL